MVNISKAKLSITSTHINKKKILPLIIFIFFGMISHATPLNAIQEINAIDNKTKRCHEKQRKKSLF